MARLTKRQKEVLHLLRLGMSPKGIASRLKISTARVYLVRSRLTKILVTDKTIEKPIEKNQWGVQNPSETLPIYAMRLHNLEFNIKPFYFSKNYKEIRKKKGNKMKVGHFLVRLYERSIELYLEEGFSFVGKDVNGAYRQAEDYCSEFFPKIEHKAGVRFLKEGKLNIKQVNCHISEMDNEIAKKENDQGKIQVIGRDNKVWFIIDNSFGLEEAEFIHPTESKVDANRIIDVFNDIRQNEVLLPSELTNIVKFLLEDRREFSANLAKHVKAVDQLYVLARRVNTILDGRKHSSMLLEKLKGAIRSKNDIFLYSRYIERLDKEEASDLDRWLLQQGYRN